MTDVLGHPITTVVVAVVRRGRKCMGDLRVPGEVSMKPDNVKSVLAIVGQILLVFGAFAGGVWATSQWTSGQENKYSNLTYRVELIEKANAGTAPGRIDRIEYRLDQVEKTNIEDRASRRQYEADVKSQLTDIQSLLTQIQIFLGPKLPRR